MRLAGSRRRRPLATVAIVSLLLHAIVLLLLARVPYRVGGPEEAVREVETRLEAAADPLEEQAPRAEVSAPAPAVRRVEARPEGSWTPPLPVARFDPIDAASLSAVSAVGRAVAPAGTVREAGPGSFEAYLGWMREEGLDVVFVIDTTASMEWVLEEAHGRIRSLVHTVRSLVPKSRFGAVAYRDQGAEYVTRGLPLTYSAQRLEQFLGALGVGQGGDVYEDVNAGVQHAIASAGYRPQARKVLLVVGDAPPRPETMDLLLERLERFRASGGSVAVLDVSFDSNPRIARRIFALAHTPKPRAGGVMPEFRELAEAGGGEVFTLGDVDRLIPQMTVAIFGSRWLDQLRPFLGGPL